MTVYLVRHAVATAKATWPDDDLLRPLNRRGRLQAQWLASWLAERAQFGLIVSSPTVRCVATVLPLAAVTGRDVLTRSELAVGRAAAAAELLQQLLRSHEDAVVCTHGEVIGPVLAQVLGRREPFVAAKGSVWTLMSDGTTAYVAPPVFARSAAADAVPAPARER